MIPSVSCDCDAVLLSFSNSVQEAVPIKKKEKRTLETFSENPPIQEQDHFLFQEIQKSKGIQKAVPTKKKEKKTLETFSEKPTCSRTGSLTILAHSKKSRSPKVSKKLFLQKRKKREH